MNLISLAGYAECIDPDLTIREYTHLLELSCRTQIHVSELFPVWKQACNYINKIVTLHNGLMDVHSFIISEEDYVYLLKMHPEFLPNLLLTGYECRFKI